MYSTSRDASERCDVVPGPWNIMNGIPSYKLACISSHQGNIAQDIAQKITVSFAAFGLPKYDVWVTILRYSCTM